jgi:hypothetical protein
MEDKDYLAALRQAFDDGRLKLDMDCAKLDHLDSPVLVQAEKAWWVFGGLFGGLGFGYVLDWHYGVGFALLVAIGYLFIGRRIMNARMRKRMRSLVMEDVALWRKQWRLKGLALVVGEARCESPDGSWVRFAMTHVTDQTPTV